MSWASQPTCFYDAPAKARNPVYGPQRNSTLKLRSEFFVTWKVDVMFAGKDCFIILCWIHSWSKSGSCFSGKSTNIPFWKSLHFLVAWVRPKQFSGWELVRWGVLTDAATFEFHQPTWRMEVLTDQGTILEPPCAICSSKSFIRTELADHWDWMLVYGYKGRWLGLVDRSEVLSYIAKLIPLVAIKP